MPWESFCLFLDCMEKNLCPCIFLLFQNWPLFKKDCSPQWSTGQEFAKQQKNLPWVFGKYLIELIIWNSQILKWFSNHLKYSIELIIWNSTYGIYLHVNILVTKVFHLFFQKKGKLYLILLNKGLHKGLLTPDKCQEVIKLSPGCGDSGDQWFNLQQDPFSTASTLFPLDCWLPQVLDWRMWTWLCACIRMVGGPDPMKLCSFTPGVFTVFLYRALDLVCFQSWQEPLDRRAGLCLPKSAPSTWKSRGTWEFPSLWTAALNQRLRGAGCVNTSFPWALSEMCSRPS